MGGGESNPWFFLVWIVPLAVLMLYGQRIQLYITLSEMSKNIEKLKRYEEDSTTNLKDYVKNNFKTKPQTEQKIDRFLEHFTIMPESMDPNGIVPKVTHIVRSKEDYTRRQVRAFTAEDDASEDGRMTTLEASKVMTLLEVATTLHLIHKAVRHFFLTAKKQKNFPLVLPLQMMLPFIMEEAEAMNKAIPTIKKGQPIGDSIGPLVVGSMMLGTKKETVALETLWSKKEYEGRTLYLMKGEGPLSTVGRPGDGAEKIISDKKPALVVMIDAALKLEGEESGTVAEGFGAAIGGIGTDRFQIESIATKHNVPVFAVVIKQSVKEAITLMRKNVAETSDEVLQRVYQIITENTDPGQTALVVGVGNTVGVAQ